MLFVLAALSPPSIAGLRRRRTRLNDRPDKRNEVRLNQTEGQRLGWRATGHFHCINFCCSTKMLGLVCRHAVKAQRVAAVGSRVRFASSFFTKEHEYAKVEGKSATCGITNFAQSQLGDVVYVSLPEVGASFKKGEAMASVESVKAASDVYAPLSGTVKEVR